MRRAAGSHPMDGEVGGTSCAGCYDKHCPSLATGAGVVVRAAAAEHPLGQEVSLPAEAALPVFLSTVCTAAPC
ncbi:hypothetical protein GRJ2_000143200 [Grus japonensis]|uniref:Uncharacterized protein n=1 Tax=Grus japonensis TaxID=30415 RepID=A0ABC9VUB0_GRUJA